MTRHRLEALMIDWLFFTVGALWVFLVAVALSILLSCGDTHAGEYERGWCAGYARAAHASQQNARRLKRQTRRGRGTSDIPQLVRNITRNAARYIVVPVIPPGAHVLLRLDDGAAFECPSGNLVDPYEPGHTPRLHGKK